MSAKNKKTRTRGKARMTTKTPRPKKPVAKKAKAATPSKAPKPKRTPASRKPAEKRRSKAVAPQRGVPEPEAIENPALALDATPDDSSGEKKPGTLARLKSGVGSLFARMTGRGTKTGSPESDGVPRDDHRTMEIVTADIILQRDVGASSLAAPSAKRDRRKPPPPPGTSED